MDDVTPTWNYSRMRIFRPHRLALTSILTVLLGACGGGHDGAPTDAGGSKPLTAVSSAGDHCEQGGNKIDVGIDADGNGSLGSNEISGTYYACNGAAGSDGASGVMSWIATSDPVVPAKANTGYIATNETAPVTVTLPDKDHIAVGDVVRVIGGGAGGWKIAQTETGAASQAGLLGRATWVATGPISRGHGGLLGRRQDPGGGR